MTARTIVISALVCGAVAGAVYPLVVRKGAMGKEPTVLASGVPAVHAALADSRPMRRTVQVTGSLRSGSQATLSPKQGGKVLAVLVQDGQNVRRGQVLVRLDRSDAIRQAEQARAGVTAARANVDKARAGSRLRHLDADQNVKQARSAVLQAEGQLRKAEAGIQLQQRAAAADIQRAQAGVDAAKSALAKARRGARPEERQQVEIAVRQAERGMQAARKNLEDVEYLHGKGGAPRVQLDAARESYQSAMDGLSKAQAQLSLVTAGAAAEDISAAEAQVRSAEAGLSAARAAANRSEVDDADLAAAKGAVRQAQDGLRAAESARLETGLSESDIRAAQAAYNQAVSAYELATQQLDSAEVVSPLDGIATQVNTHAGEIAGPGMPLLTVIGTAGVYLDAAASSRVVQSLRPGQPVEVTVDSFRGRPIAGVVTSLGAVAGADGRSFPVRIDLSAPPGQLKPGAAARATIVTASFPDAVTVPEAALRSEGDRTTVWLVRGGKVIDTPVELGVQSDGRVQVRGDVRSGDPVVLSADGVAQPGQAVRLEMESQ